MAENDKLSSWLKGAIGGGKKKRPQHHKQKQKGRGRSDHKPHKKMAAKKPKPATVEYGVMRIIPIGGLEEVGKNCMVVEHEKDLVVIDMGFQFPEDEMYGVDYVLPDIQYLKQRKKGIRGILITHGHLDHIGALPYVIKDLGFPTIYGSKLSMGFVKRILTEHKLLKQTKLKVVDVDKTLELGSFKVDWFRVNHSIPDSLGLSIRTPQGTMVHTGDFKFDFTPADGIESDIGKMSMLGKRGVDIMFSDSTNAVKPGHTMSERVVGASLEKAIRNVEGRIVIACFASLIGRMQQICDYAHANNRKVFLSGGSMIRNAEIAKELGFLKPARGVLKDIRSVKDFPDNQIVILTTGSQGEPMAALSRMSDDSHRHVKIRKGDTIVLSASPIIGNEKSVAFLIDKLSRLGAKIVHNRIMDVHTSGHGCQEDLKMMMALIKPKHLVPIHGNHYMRNAHAGLGPTVGIGEKNVHMMDNGNVIELRRGKVSFKHEDIGVRYVVIDGLGQGDLESIVLTERESMSKNGVVSVLLKMNKGRLVGNPVITTHGFAYHAELEKIEKSLEKKVREAITKLKQKESGPRVGDFERYVRSAVAGHVLRELNRRPLVSVKVMRV